MPGKISEGPAPDGVSFKFNLAHQEMTRVMTELETVFKSQPCEWLPVDAIANMLAMELGYEDLNEFEDALQGEFTDFVECLPHADLSYNERGTKVLRIKPPPSNPKPRRMRLRITDSKLLWHVFLQAPDARIILPELEEFEFQPMGERRIDTVYNHISSAIWNLGQHVAACGRQPGSMSKEHENRFLDTIHLLNKALDVEHPFTWVVEDPTSASLWQPEEGVEVQQDDGSWAPLAQKAQVKVKKTKAIGAKPAPQVDAARAELLKMTAPGVVTDHQLAAVAGGNITQARYAHWREAGQVYPDSYPPPPPGDGRDVFKAADEGGEGKCTRKEIAKYLMRNQTLRHRLREGWTAFNANFGTEDIAENHEELDVEQFVALWKKAAEMIPGAAVNPPK